MRAPAVVTVTEDLHSQVKHLAIDKKRKVRMDSAFFSQETLTLMDLYGVECTLSVPFERFPVLKQMIDSRSRWRHLDGDRFYFESDWKPKSWPATYRFLRR